MSVNNLPNDLLNESDADIVVGIIAVYAVVLGIALLVGAVFYFIRAAAIYKMAKNQGLNNPWLAFIPIVNVMPFGALAEKYEKRDGSPSAKFKIILLILQIAASIATAALMFYIVQMIGFAITNYDVEILSDSQTTELLAFVIPLLVFGLLASGIAIAYSAVYYVALWRVFNAYDKDNGTLYLVLSIFVSILEPIFLLIVSGKTPKFTKEERFALPDYLKNGNNMM